MTLTEKQIIIACQVAIPVAFIKFFVQQQDGNLNVQRKISWWPLFAFTVPVLLALEGMMIGISFVVDTQIYYSYILIALTWVIAIIFLTYQIFEELDLILKKLYRIEV